MTTSVLIRSAILVAVLAAIATAAVTKNDDLVFDGETKRSHDHLPQIEKQQPSLFNRIKRGIFDSFWGTDDDTEAETEAPKVPDTQQAGQQQEYDPPADDLDDFVDQTTIDDQEDYGDENNAVIDSAPSQLDRKPRESGEDPSGTEHPNAIDNTIGDDEDFQGSGDVEGSAETVGPPFLPTNPRTSSEPGATPVGGPSTDDRRFQTNTYRVTITISEPFKESYRDRRSADFVQLSEQLSGAIDQLYQAQQRDQLTNTRVLNFLPTDDPFTTLASLDIVSTNPKEDEVRAVIEEQLEFHDIGNIIKVKPEGFSFRSPQDPRDCNPATEVACQTGSIECVPIAGRCDGYPQCTDGSDEFGCPPVEKPGLSEPEAQPAPQNPFDSDGGNRAPYYPTEDGDVPNREVNFDNDLGGGLDDIPRRRKPDVEAYKPNRGVVCRGDTTFTCKDGTQCFGEVQKCDGVLDCDDGTDEENCPPTNESECQFDEFACDVTRCISRKHRCDFRVDCDDGTDEHDCATPECTVDQFRCKSGQCIPKEQLCDRRSNCYDQSDESSCPLCNESQFECASGDQCINDTQFCDGIPDCRDDSDETDCPDRVCPAGDFRCNDGTCLSGGSRCNEIAECPNGEDELNCACPVNHWACSDGNCIEERFRCDGTRDCNDASDEYNCPSVATQPPPVRPSCPSGYFQCSDDRCIPETAVCNGVSDCSDSGDEVNCTPRGCTANEFTCRNRECIRRELRCDRRSDCSDGSDEENCGSPVYPPVYPPAGQSLDLKTYPTEQRIKESREVVIQCRDESFTRARVHWVREDGAPLPRGSLDKNGRLEMPNVQVRDSGNYVCEALDVPEGTPGRRVISNLIVEREEVQTPRPPVACNWDEATCSNGECVPKSSVCDGRYDCTDGSDESRCSLNGCEPNQFRCANKECVSKIWRCDGDADCRDGSDEENCEQPPPGSKCKYNEFSCRTGNQCIPKSFHCDSQNDCIDGSDEIGCRAVKIITILQRMVILEVGQNFEITCSAIGVPTPEISWRLNWGHIPSKCTTTSINGTGTLSCPSVGVEDQGAYSCEGMNTLGWKFAQPDTLLTVKKQDGNVCQRGTFNSLATRPEECISCFCFGVATDCSSADLFTYQLPAPFDQYNVLSVDTYPVVSVRSEAIGSQPETRPVGRNGVQISDRYADSGNPDTVLYFALPESYHGSQLKSYGGSLKFNVRHGGRGNPNSAPAVILTGNNIVLIHKGKDVPSDFETEQSVRFFYGDWLKQDGRRETLASREEIMMALANVDNILIKAKYDDGPIDTTITSVFMDTADVRNTDLGVASFVEECRCPTGYTGLSCEHCAAGYSRRQGGPWLGQCYKETAPCPAGYYEDLSRNIPCQRCPCPGTSSSNQFAQTCNVGSDGEVICNCSPGYEGRRCEKCAPGFQGSPLIPGGSCTRVDECDAQGSLSPYVDTSTGRCRCKQLATGRTCNQCKAESFNLATTNDFGCVSCFCMGITRKCTSSNLYRSEIRIAFTNSIRDFSLVEMRSTDEPPIIDGINLDTAQREISYQSFPNRGNNDVYYWQLPRDFLGDQLTAYGGNLEYTVRYVPSPGGGRSRNNAADVELVSANDITLRHYSRQQVEPNTAVKFTVPLLEKHWQRADGTSADREHLLMALADIEAIRIKATYTTHTDEAALSSVSLDTAVNVNTGGARAVEVEQCSCPPGYRGLSCEDCDVGYTRADEGLEGLYLGVCTPCNCNGHSTQCDSETGVCEYCRDSTTGDNCELCAYGYVGDATRGTPQDCRLEGSQITDCDCNSAGALINSCDRGQCQCKPNVEGRRCDVCRPSTFGLSATNIDGCSECYCSGVTNDCQESSMYIDQLPTFIYDSNHGFTLTDLTRRDVITEGFDITTGLNKIGYLYPDSRSQKLFWSLPSSITGNQVKSYGGNLTVTQLISARPGGRNQQDQDVLLIGNGITLYWVNPREIVPGVELTYSVPLIESYWKRLTPEAGPRSASRSDLMSVLSNIDAILVRATHSSSITATYISDVSLDTAIQRNVNGRRATQVEYCRCPTGYIGTSCETCAPGYYRDVNDRSRSLIGACNICPCNGNEQQCQLDGYGSVKCYCLPGYTGADCSEYGNRPDPTPDPSVPRIVVTIRETPIQIVKVGSTVTYHCSGRSQDSDVVSITWDKQSGELPFSRTSTDNAGLLIIRDVKVSDSGVYVCQVSDGVSIEIQQLSLTVTGATEPPTRPVISPQYLSVTEGEPAEFKCSSSDQPQPALSWVRVTGDISPVASFENGVWRLPIVRKSDEAEYNCIATNSAGSTEQRTILYVTPGQSRDPEPAPTIDPTEWVGGPNEPVILRCNAPRDATISWTRSGNAALPASAEQRDGVLTIYNPSPSDSGYYICTAITYQGVETSSTARVTIQFISSGPPTVRVEPERQTVSQGAVAEVKCLVTGDPTPTVTWTKVGRPLESHIQVIGNTLRIVNPRVSDRGVYVCQASNSAGSAQGSTQLLVDRREMPELDLYPEKNQRVSVNASALLQCRVTKGLPAPTVSWTRQDGRPFASNIEQLPAGVLRFNHVRLEDGGSFVCSASNEVGSTTIIANLEVTTPPRITISPPNDRPHIVRLGDRVKLTCSATGQPNPTVMWIKNNDVDITPQSRTESIMSVAIFEITSVSYNDEGSYTCRAINGDRTVEDRIQIRVGDNAIEPNPRPDITLDPNGNSGVSIPEDKLTIPDNGQVTMRCQVYGTDQEQIILDWQRNDGRILPRGSTVNDGVLFIPVVTKDDAGVYECRGLNSYGRLLFSAISHLEIISPPRIDLEPLKQIVRPGDSPSVICRVTGDQPIDIQWSAIGRPLPYSVSQGRGLLQFNGITSADAGKYVCKATNNAGTAEAVAEVLVNEIEPVITDNQRNVNTFVGSSVKLDCQIQSPARVNWIKESGSISRNTVRRGNVLEFPEARQEDSGRYICQIINANGDRSSNYIDLRVSLDDGRRPQVPPQPQRRPQPQPQPQPQPEPLRIRASSELVNIGDTVDIQCDCTEYRDAKVQWTRPGQSLPPNAVDYGSTIRLQNIALGDGGIYRCIAETEAGRYQKDYDLVIQGSTNDQPAVETKSAPYGSGVEMDCRVDLEEPATFVWEKLGGRLPYNSQTSANKLILDNVKAEDAGTYICTASNQRVTIPIPQVLVVTGVVPNFSQARESYISFPPLPEASLQFYIEVSFKPEAYDGLILYNGQAANVGPDGDYLLLSLVGGYPEFRFNLGSNPAVIRGRRPITLGQWHTIKLQRDRKDGSMLVDGEGPYTGTAAGRFQTLDLSEPFYIGGVPDYSTVSKQASINTGFVGCISRVVLGDNPLDLTGAHTTSVGVTTCETCAENPCSNNGVCQEASTDNGYTCLCPAGYSGKLCNNVGQSCYADACGGGTCVDRENGFICQCPIGKGGSNCELDVYVEEPAFHDRNAFLGYDTPRAVRKPTKRLTKKYTGSKTRPSLSPLRKNRNRKHANHHNNHHHTKQ